MWRQICFVVMLGHNNKKNWQKQSVSLGYPLSVFNKNSTLNDEFCDAAGNGCALG